MKYTVKTQEEINELADTFYDGMALVTDRIGEISKVDETNAYIKNRFGVEPTDSELVIEGTIEEFQSVPSSAFIIKYVSLLFGVIFVGMSIFMIDSIIFASVALCMSTMFVCTFFIMSHIETFGKR